MALSENNGTGGNVGNWHVRGHSKITAQDNGSATITTTSSIESFGGYWYSGLNIHAGACVNGQWAGVDKTGVNVGTNSTVQLVSKTLKVPKTRNWQSIDCIADVRVNGFAAGFSQVHVAVDVPPKPSHTVSYNANGGSGAPGSQTKWWGEVLTLSSTRPTRANHTFLGWATSANGAVAYQPGGRFGADNNVTLYAVWKLATKPPTIQSFTAQRVDEAGNMVESGTRVKLYVTWKCDTSGDSANTVQSVTVAVQDGGTWKETPVTASGATGTGTVTLTDLSADASWRFRVAVRDKYGTVSAYTTVGPQRFLLDFSAGGRGIGIGVGAPAEGVAINGSPVTVNGCRMPRIYTGSKVITPAASSNRHTLFGEDDWAKITGTSITEGYPTVLVSNGDVTAQNVAVTGAGYEGSTKRWYVWLASNVSGMFRVNYTIII
ncbi:leucine-rich repeat (LRR) protein [Bifidobacterium pseudolongum subsp. globosum]|uniref:Leucine-rich repeat (LRR) protein n=1 Tax=Bifidobacterium pseudolongum subsp. globosum TaxID=1690 RepID=A0A4Q5AN50_9BIFI|nr:InlB B-repeat-containing protein [Bifidobacterium pseudolongum]RYQ22659.1 leucine-rich repeat (LRR) protein [Bifidobacterium pseudolongum subsp. globosum]RYQ30998.1 leucine-rich repeat (LRR) protein [Bifidobacterium pseudolongum subsp. globosum]